MEFIDLKSQYRHLKTDIDAAIQRVLDHGQYMTCEFCQSNDFSLERSAASVGTNVARMEFQANYLAAGILMPKHNFVSAFRQLAHQLA